MLTAADVGPAAGTRPPAASGPRPPLRALLGSVRVRITLTALVVVAVAMVAGGAGLVWLLHRSLTIEVTTSATTEAANVAGLVSTGSLPGRLPVRAGTAVQVVDATGRVLVASSDLPDEDPVSTVHPPVGQRRTVRARAGLIPGDEDADLLIATTVATPRGPLTVYVVGADDGTEASVRALVLALALVLPLLALVSGALAWVAAGRALRPVESIRAEVAELSARDLHRRVPVPPIRDEIGRLASTMNAMLERLEVATDRQHHFVSDASHELRSPLAALMAQVEVAGAHPDSADWPAVASAVSEEGGRLGRIVDDLLLLARSDEGQLAPGRDPVDVDELVLQEAERLRLQHRVRVDLHAVSGGRVTGDRDQLRRVVRNLAENAERHARSTVAFEVTEGRGSVVLVVADDGPGIPPGQRRRVFERFARLDEARDRPTGGTGLGLAIVGEIVSVHGGTVAAEGADGAGGASGALGGARLVVRLPAGAA